MPDPVAIAILAGISLLAFTVAGLAGYADGLDGDRYFGLVLGEPPRNVIIDNSSVLVRPEAAEKQIADNAVHLKKLP